MKKALFMIVALVALTGCQTRPIFLQEAFALNYAEIAGPNFLITESNSVGFDYIGVASLYVIETTGATKVEKKKSKYASDDIYGDASNKYYYETKGLREANARSALAYAVQKAKELGGDGIIMLRTNSEKDLIEGKMMTKYVEVKGMVIKRK